MKTNRTRRLAIASAAAVATSALATFSATPAHAEPTWLELDGVSEPGPTPAHADLAVNPEGVAIAVWRELDGEDYRIAFAARHPGQAFGEPKYISATNGDSSFPRVAIDDKGRAVFSWTRVSDSGKRLQVRHRSSGGTLSKTRTVNSSDQDVSQVALDVAPKGSAMLAWSGGNGSDTGLRLTRVGVTGSLRTWPLAKHGVSDADLDTNRTGRTAVIWDQAVGSEYRLRARLLDKNTLRPLHTLHTGNHGNVSIALNDTGKGIAAYHQPDGEVMRVVAHQIRSNGSIGGGKYLSPAGETTLAVTVATAANGLQVAAWRSNSGVETRFRGTNGIWSGLVPLVAESPSHPTLVMNDAGDVAIQWYESGPGIRTYSKLSSEPEFSPATPLQSDSLIPGMSSIGIDDQGNAVSLHGAKFGESVGRVMARVLDVVGPKVSIKATRERVNGTTFNVGWTGSDRYSEVDSVEVLRRNAPWNGSFGFAFPWALDNGPTWGAVNNGELGQTYCFAATGTDSAGNTGAMSKWRCSTTPVDDRTATPTGFGDFEGSGYIDGTYRKATEKGSKLVLPGAVAKRIGLVVAKGPGHGRIAVSFDGELLGTWSLAASKTRKKQRMLVGDFAGLETGNLVIKVISAGKPVVVDGVHVIK